MDRDRAGIAGSCLVACVLVSACALDRTGAPADAPIDAAQGRDAGVFDGGSFDAEGTDSARPDAGGIDGGPDPCSPVGPLSCSGGVETYCEASGALGTRPCSALGCNAASTACALLLPSNVEASRFDSPEAAVRIGSDASYDTSACMDGTIVPQTTGGPDVCVRVFAGLEIAGEATWTITGEHPLVVLVTGEVIIDGTIDLSATRTTPGAGGGRGGTASAGATGVRPGGRGGGSSDFYEDGGGGGGAFCGAGGDGGDGGNADGGSGGDAVSNTYTLEPLDGGSGGGFARGEMSGGVDSSASGGGGGGAIQISSRTSIAVRGAILAGGGGGEGGGATTDFFQNYGGGAGGGSGGGILLEAPAIAIESGARVWTTGGGGGGSADGEQRTGPDIARPGGPGGDGRTTGGRAARGVEGGGGYGADGGESGGGSTDGGGNGESNSNGSANGGGGGGGVGCIVIRDAAGARPSSTSEFSGTTSVGLRTAPAHRD